MHETLELLKVLVATDGALTISGIPGRPLCGERWNLHGNANASMSLSALFRRFSRGSRTPIAAFASSHLAANLMGP